MSLFLNATQNRENDGDFGIPDEFYKDMCSRCNTYSSVHCHPCLICYMPSCSMCMVMWKDIHRLASIDETKYGFTRRMKIGFLCMVCDVSMQSVFG